MKERKRADIEKERDDHLRSAKDPRFTSAQRAKFTRAAAILNQVLGNPNGNVAAVTTKPATST